MSIRTMLLLLVLVGLIVSAIVFYPQLENSLVFYPDKSLADNPSNWNLSYKDVRFVTSDGEELHGWFFPLSGKTPVLLFCHGNAGNISHRIENVNLLVKRGISVFLFGYRGYGLSSGRPSEKGIYTDGMAAYDYLTDMEKVSPDRIAVFGRSLGGAVAIEVALQKKVRCIIIENTFTSIRDMSKTIFPWLLFSPFLPDHYDNSSKIADVSVPKLIVHSRNDEIVPFRMGEELFAAATGDKIFLPIDGAGHNDIYIIGGRAYLDAVTDFVSSHASSE
jgi:fermentation-respiration switch protein FrsA (DUF1100 family)